MTNRTTGRIAGIAAGALLVILGIIVFTVVKPTGISSTIGGPGQVATSPPQDTSQPPDTAPPAVGDADIPGDGTYLLGEDIEEGDYSSTVPNDSTLCYWERLRGTSGAFDDIIANGVADPGELVTVTINKQDEAFDTKGCGAWTSRSS